jgi:hydroxypyruvate reductase/glycerate 2-kinase
MKERLAEQHKILEEIVEKVKGFKDQGKLNINSLEKGQKAWFLGAGKGSVQQAKEVIKAYDLEVEDGIIISNHNENDFSGIQVFEGSHPYPDEKSVSSSYELLELAKSIPADETVIFCLSGGASALLTIPPKGIEIEELALTNKILLESGADIHEMNVVRKHLCMLKGGQLAQFLHHVNLITLISSDVPGDDITTIGSAPTVCDPSTFKEAFQLLKKYGIWNEVPHSVRIHIAGGMGGDIPETPKPGINEHPAHEVKLISKADNLADHIAGLLIAKGLNVKVAEEAYQSDVRQVSKMICGEAISVLSRNEPVSKPAALIYFGESSVNVKGKGKGGRNQELALTAAVSIEGQHSVSMLSMGTDGLDGPTDAAGAIINSETTLKARKKKLNPEEYLQKNDSYHFHEKMETLIKTGPTGINLMDLQVILIG